MSRAQFGIFVSKREKEREKERKKENKRERERDGTEGEIWNGRVSAKSKQ